MINRNLLVKIELFFSVVDVKGGKYPFLINFQVFN